MGGGVLTRTLYVFIYKTLRTFVYIYKEKKK